MATKYVLSTTGLELGSFLEPFWYQRYWSHLQSSKQQKDYIVDICKGQHKINFICYVLTN